MVPHEGSAHDETGALREHPVKEVSEARGAVVVRLAGELDLYNAPAVRETLVESAGRDPERLVVDLSDVTFIDSTALGVLIEGRSLMENRRAFLLASPGRETTRTLEVSGLDRHFQVFDTVESALAAAL